MSSRRLLPLFLLAAATAVQASNLCFYPGGIQSFDVPCDPTAEVSMCCGSLAACLSNGLCKDDSTTNNTGVAYARGTCTDPTWQSPICPQNCQLNQDTPRNRSAYDFRVNGVQVWECDAQGYGTPARYCCESASEKTRCCATVTALFRLASASPGNALAVQTFPPPISSFSTTTTTGTTHTSTDISTSTGSIAAITTPADSSRPTNLKSSASTPTETTSASSSLAQAGSNGIGSDGGGQDHTLSRSGIIAVGVGAGVGGAAVATMLLLVLVRHIRSRNARDDASVNNLPPPGPGDRKTLIRLNTAELDSRSLSSSAGMSSSANDHWARVDEKAGYWREGGPGSIYVPELETPTESPVVGYPAFAGGHPQPPMATAAGPGSRRTQLFELA